MLGPCKCLGAERATSQGVSVGEFNTRFQSTISLSYIEGVGVV